MYSKEHNRRVTTQQASSVSVSASVSFMDNQSVAQGNADIIRLQYLYDNFIFCTTLSEKESFQAEIEAIRAKYRIKVLNVKRKHKKD